MNSSLENAAELIREAEGIIIGAGAGFGVDSGLPDFRGNAGFWNAYPPYKKQNLSFIELANPKWFELDPELAWGFYGHRTELYRTTTPHEGFGILKKWSDTKAAGSFVFTSNVDGHFQKAGFEDARVFEVHGSIHHHQCLESNKCGDIWNFENEVDIDEDFKAIGDLPICECGSISRPNILMFNDYSFLGARSDAQQERYQKWIETNQSRRLVVIEVGAGKAIPTVRYNSQELSRLLDAKVIRINLREAEGGPEVVSLSGTALGLLRELDQMIDS